MNTEVNKYLVKYFPEININGLRFTLTCWKRKVGSACESCPLRFMCLTTVGGCINTIEVSKEQAIENFEVDGYYSNYNGSLVIKNSKAMKSNGALEKQLNGTVCRNG